ncbi:hypothetical protein L4C34_14275 [Vibrio profundum]|uniref:hypothetical protein n=1 Tax=Vibrio profundum TaxID=2910247 RepID=UPI003D1102E6
MTRIMSKVKRIEDITIEDLETHRWCFYQNDEEGYDAFEHVISGEHPDFSEDVLELEYAEFEFSNGKVVWGLYDGLESFNIVTPSEWYSLWYGIAKPESEDIERLSEFLSSEGLKLPVVAKAKWSGTKRTYNGIQYINENDEVREIVI